MSAQQQEPVNLDAEKVIAIQTEKINGLTWQNTLLEARALQAETRCDELLKALSERTATPEGSSVQVTP